MSSVRVGRATWRVVEASTSEILSWRNTGSRSSMGPMTMRRSEGSSSCCTRYATPLNRINPVSPANRQRDDYSRAGRDFVGAR